MRGRTFAPSCRKNWSKNKNFRYLNYICLHSTLFSFTCIQLVFFQKLKLKFEIRLHQEFKNLELGRFFAPSYRKNWFKNKVFLILSLILSPFNNLPLHLHPINFFRKKAQNIWKNITARTQKPGWGVELLLHHVEKIDLKIRIFDICTTFVSIQHYSASLASNLFFFQKLKLKFEIRLHQEFKNLEFGRFFAPSYRKNWFKNNFFVIFRKFLAFIATLQYLLSNSIGF